MPEDLNIERFTDNDGALYTGNRRSAMYQWIRPGYTAIALFEMVDGEERCYEGHCIQGEKAEGICRRWIEEGTANLNWRSW